MKLRYLDILSAAMVAAELSMSPTAAFLIPAVGGRGELKLPATETAKSVYTKTRLFASIVPKQQQQTNGEEVASTKRESSSSQNDGEAAVDALKRLLSRQESELGETKRLLELYESVVAKTQNGTDAAWQEGDETSNSELLSVASSVLKGFDYGFQSRSEGPSFKNLMGGRSDSPAFVGYGPPTNIFSLGTQQFMRNLDAIRNEYKDEDDVEYTPKQIKLQEKLEQLTLDSTAIWERETKDGPIVAPLVIKLPYLALCWLLDVVFEGKYVPSRFFLLETVARMPYFSYITMLHLYETLGFWRRSADIKRIHFAEELNEFRHLLIMESLGGDQRWWVRFMAQHSAIAYYIGLCFLWGLSPSLSYKFSELLETHAVNTYSQFLDENEQALQELPPSLAAVDYYALGASDTYYAEFQTTAFTKNEEIRRPGLQMESLYDVFTAIRDDEGDHVSTMEACLDPNVAKVSPSLEKKILTGIVAAAAISIFLNTGTDVGVEELSGIADGVDVVTDETVASGVVDAAIAGVAGFATRAGLFDPDNAMLEEDILLNVQGLLADLAGFFTGLL